MLKKLTQIQRCKAIQKLVEEAIDKCIQLHDEQDDFYLGNIFENGFKGFSNFTDKELQQEYKEIFDEELI